MDDNKKRVMCCGVVGALVGMLLHGQLLEGDADLAQGRLRSDSQEFVEGWSLRRPRSNKQNRHHNPCL